MISLVEGGSIEETWQVTPEMIADYLETLPPKEFHCAQLGAETLFLALADCQQKHKNPWKKFYQIYE